ncbi:MAG TPA: GNAT family N-acetyltransferase [Burkholderiales bacterium]|jgi:GNAT superfamily N-acetyltransferase
MVVVRRAEPHDAEAAVAVVRRSISELCCDDHRGDADTIARWLSNKTVQNFTSWMANDDNFFVIAENRGHLSGVGLLHRSGEINLFYMAPNAQRQGLGKAIHVALEQKAQEWGLREMKLDSTLLACPFYEKLGYHPAGAKRPRFGVLCSYPYKKRLHES